MLECFGGSTDGRWREEVDRWVEGKGGYSDGGMDQWIGGLDGWLCRRRVKRTWDKCGPLCVNTSVATQMLDVITF